MGLGENLRFRLDPERSQITLSGEVVALDTSVPLKEQGPGALTTQCDGFLNVILEEGVLTFPGGSEVMPREANSWKPGIDGVEGEGLASFGVTAQLRVFIFTALAHAASRNVILDVFSPPLVITEGEYPAKNLVMLFADGAGSAVDFRVTGAVEEAGRIMAEGFLTNRLESLGRLEMLGGVQTLTVPIDATFNLEMETSVGLTVYKLDFVGEVVGVQDDTLTPPPPAITYMSPALNAGVLQLVFPEDEFKLQRSPTFNPPQWTDFATESPVDVVPEAESGYFRVVPKDP
jgi:hypothetical protein